MIAQAYLFPRVNTITFVLVGPVNYFTLASKTGIIFNVFLL